MSAKECAECCHVREAHSKGVCWDDSAGECDCTEFVPCADPKFTLDPFSILNDDEWRELHDGLTEMANRRRLVETLSAATPMCGVIAPGWRRLCDVLLYAALDDDATADHGYPDGIA